MHIIKRKTLKIFWERHPDAEDALKTWFKYVNSAVWKTPADIKSMFRSVDFLESNRVCFNIKGNKYRLIVKVIYELNRVYIRFIGTHTEYEKIDATKI